MKTQTVNPKLASLSKQIMNNLGTDSKSKKIRQQVNTLVKLFSTSEAAEEQETPETPMISRSTKLASARPGMLTERRAVRKAAKFTLKQVAKMAHTTLPTAKIYEIKRTAVRADKRADLDKVYDQLRKQA